MNQVKARSWIKFNCGLAVFLNSFSGDILSPDEKGKDYNAGN